MLELDLKLTEIFKTGSLKTYVTQARCATPAHGSLCYVWNDGKNQLKERLESGSKFKPGGDSVNNLIELSDSTYGMCCQSTIITGPNCTSKTQTVRFIEQENTTRILFSGWGSSSILLWEGNTSDLIKYLTEHQPELEVGK